MAKKNKHIQRVTDSQISRVMAELGRRNGSLGGKTAAANMTPEQLRERGKKAAAARWKRQGELSDRENAN